MTEPDPCLHFRPSTTDSFLCRWWILPPPTALILWDAFCCSTMRLDSRCPTKGVNPRGREQEEE